jgi:hypothetical protein
LTRGTVDHMSKSIKPTKVIRVTKVTKVAKVTKSAKGLKFELQVPTVLDVQGFVYDGDPETGMVIGKGRSSSSSEKKKKWCCPEAYLYYCFWQISDPRYAKDVLLKINDHGDAADFKKALDKTAYVKWLREERKTKKFLAEIDHDVAVDRVKPEVKVKLMEHTLRVSLEQSTRLLKIKPPPSSATDDDEDDDEEVIKFYRQAGFCPELWTVDGVNQLAILFKKLTGYGEPTASPESKEKPTKLPVEVDKVVDPSGSSDVHKSLKRKSDEMRASPDEGSVKKLAC